MEAGNFFQHLNNFPALPSIYVEEALASNYGLADSTKIYSANSEIFKKSKFYKILLNQFGYVNADFLKVSSKTIYNWHRDKGRKCALNWPLISDTKNLTLIKDSTIKQQIFEFQEVEYVNLKPTLLNTTYSHCVINPTQTDRLILTVSVHENCSYENMKSFLNTLNILKNDY